MQIKEIRKDGNFQTIKKTIGVDRLKEFFNAIYPKFSITEIEAITGIPDSTLQHWFSRLGIAMVRNHIANLVFPANFNGQIVLQEKDSSKKVSAIEITPELSYVIGFALGDGSVQKYMVEVFNQDKNLRTHLYKLLKPYGTITEDERDDGLWRLRLSNVKIANLIKNDKEIRYDTVKFILNDPILASQFIAGFWDAEGTVAKRNSYFDLLLWNTNETLMKLIRGYFERSGIKTSFGSYDYTNRKYLLKGKPVMARKRMHRIRVLLQSHKIWAEKIGRNLVHSKKSICASQILRGGN